MITLAIAADHRGYKFKTALMHLNNIGNHDIRWIDEGTINAQRTNFPPYAFKAIAHVRNKDADGAILLCGSGIGMSIAANRWRGIHAALVWNQDVAKSAKESNHANVLVLPADYLTLKTCIALIDTWLSASFLDGTYQERIDQIDQFGS